MGRKKVTNLPAIVGKAIVLQRHVREMQGTLEELKGTIRSAAQLERRRRGGGDELVEFDSPEGTATVCFVKDTMHLVVGADPFTLQGAIPDRAWRALFEPRAVLVRGFVDRLSAMTLAKRERKSVERLVEWVTGVPRVILPK